MAKLTNDSTKWSQTFTPDVSTKKVITLNTKDKYLDRNIELTIDGMNSGRAATFANVTTSTATTSVPIVNSAGYTGTKNISALTIPASKTLDVTMTAGTSTTSTTLNINRPTSSSTYTNVYLKGGTVSNSFVYLQSGNNISTFNQAGTIAVLSGAGAITTDSGTGTITTKTGSRTITNLGNSTTAGTLNITTNTYGTINVWGGKTKDKGVTIANHVVTVDGDGTNAGTAVTNSSGDLITGSATTPTESGASTSTSLSGTTLTVARSVTPTVSEGWVSSGTAGTVTITGTVPTEEKTVTPSTASQTINPTSGKLISKITVSATSKDTAKSVVGNASFANAATSGVTYTDYTSSGPVLKSGDYLYINEGYTPARKISLAKLVPDGVTLGTGATSIADGMLNTFAAYDNDGALITGNIVTKTDSGNASLSSSTLSKSYAAGYYPNVHGASISASSTGTSKSGDKVSTISPTTSTQYVNVTAGATAPKYWEISGVSEATAKSKLGNATVSANSPTITPSIASTVTSGTTNYAITGSATTSVSVGTAGYISSSNGTKNTGTASISGSVAQSQVSTSGVTVPNGTTPTNIAKNTNIKISAGYYPTDRYYKTQDYNANSFTSGTYIASGAVTSADIGTYRYLTIGGAASAKDTSSATITGGSGNETTPTTMSILTTAPTSGNYYTITANGSGNSKITTAGWIGTGSLASASTTKDYYIKKGVITNNTSGGTSSGTINRGSQIKISAGYYPSDLYYQAQGDAHGNIGFSNVSLTANSTTGAGSGYIPLVTTAGASALQWMNGLTIPASKTLSTISLTAGTSSNRTYLSTLNIPGYTTVSKINLSGILSEISLQGGHAYLKSNDATNGSLVYVNSYNDASTPTLTGDKLIVQNNKWVKTSLSATSASGNYYGWISYTKPSSGIITPNTSLASGKTANTTKLNKNTYIKVGAGYYSDDVYYQVENYTVESHTAGTITTNVTTLPSGATSSGTINRNSYIKIGKGSYENDLYYLAQADAHSTFTPSGTYFTTDNTDTSKIVSTTAVIQANKYNSNNWYLKKGTASAISGGGVSNGSGVTVSSTTNSSGVYVTRAAANYSISTAGWISSAGNGLSATNYYINGVNITKPSSGEKTFSITVPNGSDTVTFVFHVKSDGDVYVTS